MKILSAFLFQQMQEAPERVKEWGDGEFDCGQRSQ